MSREILDCLKRERDICVQNVIYSQNTAFMFTPALIIKITIFEKRIAKLWKKGKIRIKIPAKEMKNLPPVIRAKASALTFARHYNFECDWLI